jgi:DNA-binding NtrC family response regulator
MTTQTAEVQRERVRQKILVVEDEADIRELLRYNLAQEGFMVIECPLAGTARLTPHPNRKDSRTQP